jgi:hypothetical protein
MSFLRRIFTRADAKPPEPRHDAQTSVPGELITGGRESTDPYTKDWTLQGITSHGNKDHRELRTEYDPRAYLWVIEIARAVWSDGFGFVDVDGQTLDEMQPVLDELKRLRFTEHMERACVEDRKHGWSVIYKVYEGSRPKAGKPDDTEWGMEAFMGDPQALSDTPAPTGRPILWLDTIPTKCLQMMKVTDWNEPEILRYTSDLHGDTPQGKAVLVDIHASRLWFNNPRPKDRHWQGYSALAPIWEILCMIDTIERNMAWNSGKVGFYKEIWYKQGSLTDADATAMKAAQQAAGPRRFEMIRDGTWRAELLSPNIGDSQFDVMLDKAYEALSSGTGLTTARWKGVQQGQVTGSRTNLRLERAVMSAIQASYEPLIRSVVEELFPGRYPEYYIDWTRDEQLDDLERAELDKMKAETQAQVADIASVDERRKIMGLHGPPPEGVDGGISTAHEQQKALQELAKAGAQGPGGEKEKPADKPTRSDAYAARDQRVFGLFVSHWKGQGYSGKAIQRECGMSSKTFYRWLGEERDGGLTKTDISL